MAENYAIFEGGGAKGIAHAAAYAAATAQNLRFDGVAGTSAGAIFASLVAFGYEPTEILDPYRPHANVLNTVAKASPVDLLGGDAKFQRLKDMLGSLGSIGRWGMGIGALLGYQFSNIYKDEISSLASELGLLDTKQVQITLNVAYAAKLKQFYDAIDPAAFPVAELRRRRFADPATLVLFRDLSEALAIQRGTKVVQPHFAVLKTVLTDVSHRRIVLCDPVATPDVAVAEAVAASASIPLIFKPAMPTEADAMLGHLGTPPQVGQNRTLKALWKSGPHAPSAFVDGGLVSNLPTWAFEPERQVAAQGARVYAFAITDSDLTDELLATRRKQERKLPAYIAALLRTAIFGGQEATRDYVSRTAKISVPCDLDVLDFDLTMDMTMSAYKRAFAATAKQFVKELKVRPKIVAATLKRIQARAAALLAAAGVPVRNSAAIAVAVAVPFGRNALRVESGNAVGLSKFGLEEFVVPDNAAGFGDCFFKRELVFVACDDLNDGRVNPSVGTRLAALKSDFIGVPIFADLAQYAEPSQAPLAVAGIFVPADLVADLAVLKIGRAHV